MVINRHQPVSFDPAQEIGQPLEVVATEQVLSVIVLAEIIGWIEIEQRLRAIVSLDELGIAQVLDGNPPQPIVNRLDGAPKIGSREGFAALAPGGKRGLAGLAALGQPLKGQTAGGALDVGQGIGVDLKVALELLAADQLQPHFTEQRFRVIFDHPEQGDHFPGAIIDRLAGRRGLAQDDATHADEGFGVEVVGRGLDAAD